MGRMGNDGTFCALRGQGRGDFPPDPNQIRLNPLEFEDVLRKNRRVRSGIAPDNCDITGHFEYFWEFRGNFFSLILTLHIVVTRL